MWGRFYTFLDFGTHFAIEALPQTRFLGRSVALLYHIEKARDVFSGPHPFGIFIACVRLACALLTFCTGTSVDFRGPVHRLTYLQRQQRHRAMLQCNR